MKKYLSVIFLCIMVVGLCACIDITRDVKTHEVVSEIYSQEDISSAIEVIKREFKSDWSGCTLTEIYYAGDDTSKDFKAWADRNDADEVMVLASSFDVDSSGGDGSLNPNSTYDGWNWILVRNIGGKFELIICKNGI